jgi:hypothetical protein
MRLKMRFKEFITEWSNTASGIRKSLEKKGYKYIGKGVDQSAYLEPKTGRVLKVFGTGHGGDDAGFSKDQYMFKAWAAYCKKNSTNEFLPKFDGWESFKWKEEMYLQIRMEKLQKLPDDLANALENISEEIDRSHNKAKTINDIVMHVHELDNEDESPIHLLRSQAEAIEELMVLLGEKDFRLLLTTIGDLSRIAYDDGYRFDLHGGNFMHRNDGIPVIVDPWVI